MTTDNSRFYYDPLILLQLQGSGKEKSVIYNSFKRQYKLSVMQQNQRTNDVW